MPTYRFYNSKTKTEFEDYMSISDMEKFTKKKHIELLLPTQMNIVSSVGSVDSKTDSGFKEVLSKIGDAHPGSDLHKSHGSKDIKREKSVNVIKKHAAIQARDKK